jgi:hypothetical protein
MNLTTLFVITLLFKDLLSSYFGETLISYSLLGLFLAFTVNFFFVKEKINKKYALLIFILGIIYLLRIIFFGFNLVPYLLGPVIVFFTPNDWLAKHKKILIIIALVNIFLMMFESYTGNYIYELTVSDGTILNSKLFGGNIGVFRAKGIFPGPLSAVAFAYCLGLAYSFNKLSSILIIIIGLLSLGRLSIFIGLFFFFYNSRNSKLFGFLVAITVVIVFNQFSENIISFISSALDIEDSNNLSRFYHWGIALNFIYNFGIHEFLLGSSLLVQNSSSFESDWIRIFYSTGVFGIIAYIYMIFMIKVDSSLIIAVTIALIMFIFPFVQSLSITVLFSLLIKQSFYDKKHI